MNFFQKLGLPSYNKYRRRAYLNIDTLPIAFWFAIHETNDYNGLVIKGRYSDDELDDLWTEIQQQYIDEFGLDEKFAEYLRLNKKLINLKIDLAVTERRHLENVILIVQSDIDGLYTAQKQTFHDNLVLLEKSYQIIIDPMTTSTKKYYYYIKHG